MEMKAEWLELFNSSTIKLDRHKIVTNNNLDEDPHSIKELSLCNCNLKLLPEKISQHLSNLVQLNLTNNNICDLPQSISSLKKLAHFTLDRNNIQQFPAVICDLENLIELSISENKLAVLPSNMEKLKQLRILNISGNKIRSLPTSWTTMNNLTSLDISNNLFKVIPTCLREGMPKIELLNVSQNKNMNINSMVFSNNLKKFYAKNNKFIKTTYPKWIFSGKYSELDELNFEGTQFEKIHIPIIENKISVKKLSFNQCKLYDALLEKLLINISSIECLEISNTIPSDTRNSFVSLPYKSILNPHKLMTMSIADTGLVDVSVSIQTFTNLREINFQQNYISWLPEEICNLKRLEVLNISENTMIMLPQNLGSMTSLKILEASVNYISSLPSSICNLKNLEYVDLYRNSFTEMPKEIEAIKSLVALDLELNHFITDDTKLSIRYSDLRNQLRIDKPNRIVGHEINHNDSEFSLSNITSSEENYLSDDVESIQEETNDSNEILKEENWDIQDDSLDEFDPFDPPPTPPSYWQMPSTLLDVRFNFCPADLHPPRIRDIIARSRANGLSPVQSPIVEGQFDDAD